MKLRQEALSSFRSLFDSNDPFILSHGTNSIRAHKKAIPKELKSDEGIKKLIQRAFPRYQTSPEQRKQAGRWARVIQLHYKGHYSERLTAEEMNVSPLVVNSIKRAIHRKIAGVRADGSGEYKKKAKR